MKKVITAFALSIISLGFAQQIDDGYAPVINNISTPLNTGAYSALLSGATPDLSRDWAHLFVIRHKNSLYNYQLQIASSYAENDRLFFRKFAYEDLSPRNTPWFEVATRESNTFTGNQIINGNVGIGTATPSAFLEVYSPNIEVGKNDTQKWSSRNTEYNLKLQTIWNEHGINQEFVQRYDGVDYASLSFFAGKVGIGTSTPDSKLAVNGTIHSKEVKVDMNGWPDYVFKKEYNIPTLTEVEDQIVKKGHLENIPSEEEVLKNGINLGEMNAKLLQKIEELTLYLIEQNKSIENLVKENKFQNDEILNLKRKLLSN